MSRHSEVSLSLQRIFRSTSFHNIILGCQKSSALQELVRKKVFLPRGFCKPTIWSDKTSSTEIIVHVVSVF